MLNETDVETTTTTHAVTVSEVTLIRGDVLEDTTTPAVLLSQDPSAQNESAVTTSSPTPQAEAPATRRLSAGEAFAEAVGIDLNSIGRVEARKIMSVEHKVLGFRPPHGSLAAAAQAAAARHPEPQVAEEQPNGSHTANSPVDAEKLKEAAREDAQRIIAERSKQAAPASHTEAEVADVSISVANTTAAVASARTAGAVTRGITGAEGAQQRQGSSAASTGNEQRPRQRRNSNQVISRRASDEQIKRRSMSMGRGDNLSQIRGSNHSEKIGLPAMGGARGRGETLNMAALRDVDRTKATSGHDDAYATGYTQGGVQDLGGPDAITKGTGENAGKVPENEQAGGAQTLEMEKHAGIAAEVGRDRAVPIGGESGDDVGDSTEDGDERGGYDEIKEDPELPEEGKAQPSMERSETTDSVQIIGDVLG